MSSFDRRWNSSRRAADHLNASCASSAFSKVIMSIVIGVTLLTAASGLSLAQAGRSGSTQRNFLLYGDIKVDEAGLAAGQPMIVDVILYTKGGMVTARQRINPNGRYRFMDIFDGDYWLVVESDGVEVARDSVFIAKSMTIDIRHDISLTLRSSPRVLSGRGVVISSADLYNRSAANESLYQKAAKEIESKNYSQAITTLQGVVNSDPNDFKAWSDLGMLFFLQKDLEAAENSYTSATKARASYFPAIFNLGRVRLAKKNYDGAIEALEAALKLDAKSASANYFLGEAYLQIKKGSKAVIYLNQALALDPVGMADAHLRLAVLYNGAGMKDKAVTEYEQFLKAKPDYPERSKLEKYISDNKKP
jgi:Tfp pilus assembly protein PilF